MEEYVQLVQKNCNGTKQTTHIHMHASVVQGTRTYVYM
jgi:hypothetical protein